MSRSETSGLPSSTSSSIPKKAWGVALRSSVKNSASDIGTPSSTFLSEVTEGLTRFCSMREMSPLVTPARRASSRCETPKVVRTLRSRAPTSMVTVFRILDKSREIVPPVAPFVHFIYHPQSFQAKSPSSHPSLTEQPMSNATAPMSRSELEAFWMPFTANRQFKAKPRLLAKGSLARPPDRARARLSRRGLRRHLGGRHGAEPQGLVGIAPPGRRSPAAHARSGEERLLARRSGARRGAGG